ncbi:MAG: transposase [Candidatus Aminicenantes bacterium]|nr:transposase [Candidatus Aminicenantes bacterium]
MKLPLEVAFFPIIQLKKLADFLMKIEAKVKVGAPKSKPSKRWTYFSGVRIRKLHPRVGTLYLVIPKVRKGGYITLFLTDYLDRRDL